MDDNKANTYAEEGGNVPGEKTERDRLEAEQAERDGKVPSGEEGGVPAEEREAFDEANKEAGEGEEDAKTDD